eukprot:10963142-Ditylum_brightwellii.AAC.1
MPAELPISYDATNSNLRYMASTSALSMWMTMVSTRFALFPNFCAPLLTVKCGTGSTESWSLRSSASASFCTRLGCISMILPGDAVCCVLKLFWH